MKKSWLSITLLALLLGFLPACTRTETVNTNIPASAVSLPLERLDIHPHLKSAHYGDTGIQVHVMVDHLTLPPLLQFSAFPDDPPSLYQERQSLLQVDYAQYFVVCAFIGAAPQAAPQIKIEKVWQDGATLYIWANFNPPSTSSRPSLEKYDVIPFDAAKINKESLPAYGEVKVVLLDQGGVTKAESTCVIPQGAPLQDEPINFLPLARGVYKPDSGQASIIEGPLILENGAVYIKDHATGVKYLVIWPPSCSVWLQGGSLWVGMRDTTDFHEDDRMLQEVEAEMETLGVPIDAVAAEKCIDRPLPAGYTGPFWYVKYVGQYV